MMKMIRASSVWQLSVLKVLVLISLGVICAPASGQTPPIDYATYFGGSSSETMGGIAVDAQGFIYVCGRTHSTDLTPNKSFGDTTRNDNKGVAFLAKLNPQAATPESSLVYLTMFGSTTRSQAYDLALDPTGSAVYICGSTSVGFVTKSPLNTTLATFQGGTQDAFVVCVDSATGQALNYSVLLGRTNSDLAFRMKVDSSGNVHVGGYSNHDGSTTIGGDPNTRTFGPLGDNDAFAAVLNSTGSQVMASVLIGGSGSEWLDAITLDTSGNTYLGGASRTNPDPAAAATWFPTTADALKEEPTPPPDGGDGGGGKGNGKGKGGSSEPTLLHYGFFVRLSPGYETLEYSTLIDGPQGEVRDIQIHNNRAYLAGKTQSAELPLVNPIVDTTIGLTGDQLSGTMDAIVMVLDFSAFNPGVVAPTLAFSTYLGGDYQQTDGAHEDAASHLHVDSAGRIYLFGTALGFEPTSTNGKGKKNQEPAKLFPLKGLPQYKSDPQDRKDHFLTIFSPSGNGYSVAYSSLLGGTGLDNTGSFVFGAQGKIHLTWGTYAIDLAVTSNAPFGTNPGGSSGYVIKIPNPAAGN